MKKILSVIIIFILFAGVLSACGGDETNISETVNNNDTLNQTEEEQAVTNGEPPFMGYTFPDVHYDGYEFTILNADVQNIVWSYTRMVSEGETGEIINDAVFRRNVLVEDTLGIKINETAVPRENIASLVTRSVAAGLGTYDIVFSLDGHTGTLTTQGVLLDLYNIEELSLSSPWWDQNAQQRLTLGGKLHMVGSPAHVAYYAQLWCVFFNKKIVADLSLENPYTLLNENRWTFDKLYEMARAAGRDINGDGIFDLDDQWGVIGHSNLAQAMIFGMGEDTIYIDNTGMPAAQAPTERFISGFEKIMWFFPPGNGLMIREGNSMFSVFQNGHRDYFSHGRALFHIETLGCIHGFRNMDDEFGFLPIPKLDEAQDRYYSWTGAATPLMVIPKDNADTARTGIIANALTAVSADTVTPAYYDLTITRKAVRDEESLVSLEIMRQACWYDIGLLYGWNGLMGGYTNAINSASNQGPATIYERNEASVNTAIQRTLEVMQNEPD